MTATATVQSHIAYDLIAATHTSPEVTVIEFPESGYRWAEHQAEELRQQLESLIWAGVPRNFVIDFGNVRALGSSVFAVIAGFIRKYGHVRACNISHGLRLGAALTGLENWVQYADSREAVILEAKRDARRGQDETEDYPVVTDDAECEPSHAAS